MKSTPKAKKIILITLGILFALSPIIINDLKINEGINNESDLDIENLKVSAVSAKINIDGDAGWASAKIAGIVSGNGTYSIPYILEDLVVDAEGSGSGILIARSNVNFKIQNCTVSNSGNESHDAGIRLSNVNNGQLINNTVYNNYNGIDLFYSSNNNSISGNIVFNNSQGIILGTCDDNRIVGNIVTNNFDGILLAVSHQNTISGNTVNNNTEGISLYFNVNNSILGNTVKYNHERGIYLRDCINSTISGNLMTKSGLQVIGSIEKLGSLNIDTTNLVNGKPLYYYTNETNLGPNNFTNAGQVILVNVEDSLISNLNVSDGSIGISLSYCNNNNISGNTANNNLIVGIILIYSTNNNILRNTANNNVVMGIELDFSNNNNILGNTANDNWVYGIGFYYSDNNTVSGNTLIGNYGCIYEYDSQGNEFSNNGGCQGGEIIPGYNLFFLLGVLSVVVIILSKEIYSKKFTIQ